MIEFVRQTLSQDLEFEGNGLHSGVPVKVWVRPGEDGIWFRHGQERVQAIPENVSDTTRCTRLGSIATIEHLMSAFAGVGITDAEIELSELELPALDGASWVFATALDAVPKAELGTVQLEGLYARVYEKEDSHSIAIARGDGWWRYEFLTGDRWPGSQDFEFRCSPESYIAQIAPARTFGFEEELPQIKAAGLAKGLDETSALVLGQEGYLNTPKFADEPVRHKLLDLIGDLYLAGIPPTLLSVVADRSGHTANVRAAKKLRASVRAVNG
ncbi:MAG: UDP-3-O-acyl-N-acetylglucosamine deacetylase [Armatimonadetes bacterium]|nr:UDP-3-O-acyl-N-acetylglucosamine deacetylase [Armatimonadota bacterium]